MKKEIFRGSGTALITPFNEKGVNYLKLEELIEYQIAHKTDALIVCGSTGEASTLSMDEHKAVIKFCTEKVNKRIPVIAGTGSNDTRHAIELSVFAESVGSDGVLCVTPYYNKATQKGLYEHFSKIARSISIPMILYNVPSRTNLNIDPNTVEALSKIDNIVGIKECNFNQVGAIIQRCEDDFSVYSGEDSLVVPLLSLGGKGVISVMANIIPEETHDMVERFFAGDLEASRRIQLKVLPLIEALFIEVSPMPTKAALNILGFNVNKCRLPLVEMSYENLEILKNTLIDYELL